MKREHVFITILTIFISYMIVEASRYPFHAKLFPMFTASVTLITLLVIFYKSIKAGGLSKGLIVMSFRGAKKEFIVIGWFVLFCAGTYIFGHYIGIPLISLLFFKYFAKYSWIRSILYALIMFLITLIFSYAFPLSSGLIGLGR